MRPCERAAIPHIAACCLAFGTVGRFSHPFQSDCGGTCGNNLVSGTVSFCVVNQKARAADVGARGDATGARAGRQVAGEGGKDTDPVPRDPHQRPGTRPGRRRRQRLGRGRQRGRRSAGHAGAGKLPQAIGAPASRRCTPLSVRGGTTMQPLCGALWLAEPAARLSSLSTAKCCIGTSHCSLAVFFVQATAWTTSTAASRALCAAQ